ncbi:hypothetical protein A3C75_02270 [Candidatus Giovannonibacteria bacterium RIFCSPHIGHO2_02_FULL_44_31]|nr:MAG: hypothetical protein A3C75_02270 [Candidatus Giovannonibacteria bacterium RIFCSPHIGHO2_02_FULL_44_31]
MSQKTYEAMVLGKTEKKSWFFGMDTNGMNYIVALQVPELIATLSLDYRTFDEYCLAEVGKKVQLVVHYSDYYSGVVGREIRSI